MNKYNHTKKNVRTNNKTESSRNEHPIFSKMTNDMKTMHFNGSILGLTDAYPNWDSGFVSTVLSLCSRLYKLIFDDYFDENNDKWMTVADPCVLNKIILMAVICGGCPLEYIKLMKEYAEKNTAIAIRRSKLMNDPKFQSDYEKCFS